MRINEIFRTAVENTVPIPQDFVARYRDVQICNVVSNVELLFKEERLSVYSILQQSSGMVKLNPKNFAAAVLRIKDFIGTTTCLVFQSGKMLNVGAVSREHARYACQMYRRFVENVPFVHQDGAELEVNTLEQRTIFADWKVNNIVCHVFVAYRPDLLALLHAAADSANWQPGIFPGLKFLIWLNPKTECPHKGTDKTSCACNVTAIIFDSGKIVLTGGTSIRDVNLAKHRLLRLLDEEEFQDSGKQLPRNQRFEARRKKFLENPYLSFVGIQTKKKRKRLDEDDVNLNIPELKKSKVSETITPFMLACERGNFDMVRVLLTDAVMQETDEAGNTALQRLLHIQPKDLTENHRAIIEFLQKEL